MPVFFALRTSFHSDSWGASTAAREVNISGKLHNTLPIKRCLGSLQMKRMQDTMESMQRSLSRAEVLSAFLPAPLLTAGLSHPNTSAEKPSRKGRSFQRKENVCWLIFALFSRKPHQWQGRLRQGEVSEANSLERFLKLLKHPDEFKGWWN